MPTTTTTDQPREATPEESLDALYNLVRQVNLPADAHDAMRAARDTVAAALARASEATTG